LFFFRKAQWDLSGEGVNSTFPSQNASADHQVTNNGMTLITGWLSIICPKPFSTGVHSTPVGSSVTRDMYFKSY